METIAPCSAPPNVASSTVRSVSRWTTSFLPTIARRWGANKGDPAEDHGLGRSRGGFGSTLHLTAERDGKQLVATLTAGQRHESTEAISLVNETLARMWPDAVAGDKAYSTVAIRNWLIAREAAMVIPDRDNESGSKAYDREAYRDRPIIERTINRLKRYRRIATRYEKLAATYFAMVTIACILEWL